MEIPEPLVRRLLATWPVARLATARPDGAPHLVPVVFAASGGALWSPVDRKPKREGELARVRHVQREPRVSLLVDRYEADWSHLWWVRVDGRARVLRRPDPASGSEDLDAFDEAAAALREKYPQYERVPLFRGTPTLIRIEPTRIASWCAGEAALARLTDR